MRRTMFVVPAGLVPVVQAACTDDVARRLRRQLEKDLAAGGVGDGDPGGWLTGRRARGCCGCWHARRRRRVRCAAVRGRAAAADAAVGLARQELRRHLQHHLAGAHAARRRGAPGAGAPARRLVIRAVRVVRGLDLAGRAGRLTGGLDGGAARVELARRWLRSFGPAPVSDLQWWGGWTGGQTKAALAALPTVEVELDGQPGVALADDLEFPAAVRAGRLAAARARPDARWGGRRGTGSSASTGRRCSTGPATSGRPSGGRGGWSAAGRSALPGRWCYRLLEDIGADGAAAVSGAAARLEAWLGANRVTPRFRTPLERELSA